MSMSNMSQKEQQKKLAEMLLETLLDKKKKCNKFLFDSEKVEIVNEMSTEDLLIEQGKGQPDWLSYCLFKMERENQVKIGFYKLSLHNPSKRAVQKIVQSFCKDIVGVFLYQHSIPEKVNLPDEPTDVYKIIQLVSEDTEENRYFRVQLRNNLISVLNMAVNQVPCNMEHTVDFTKYKSISLYEEDDCKIDEVD